MEYYASSDDDDDIDDASIACKNDYDGYRHTKHQKRNIKGKILNKKSKHLGASCLKKTRQSKHCKLYQKQIFVYV